MKIYVKEAERTINLYFPNSLLTSSIVIKIIVKEAVKRSKYPLNEAMLEMLLNELKYVIKDYKGLEIIHVLSSKKEEVRIIL